MKILSAFLAMTVTAARAQGLPAFHFVGVEQVRESKSEVAAPRSALGDEITKDHLIVQAGKTVLFGYAQNDAQFREAVKYWSDALAQAGVRVGDPTFADGLYQIPYATADGRVIRSFLADPKQFPPKDPSGLRANMASTRAALEKAGLTVVAARAVSVDEILPTYSVLYLTKADENPEHEVLLRVLKPGDDIDAGVFRDAGLTVVQTPETWMMVYIGPEAGLVSMAAKTPEDLDRKVAARREFLTGEGKKILAEKREPIDDAEYKFGASLYFLQ